jgi:hypothetical protein
MRPALALMAAASLAACTAGLSDIPTPPADQPWQIDYRDDAIAGKAKVAILPFKSVYNPLSGEEFKGEMRLVCFKRQPIVWIGFNFKIGSNQNAALTYRFDEKPAVDAKARFLRNYSTVVIEDPSEVRRFLADLASANKLSILIASLVTENTNLTLNVRGGAAAIEAIVSGCPLPPTATPKQV